MNKRIQEGRRFLQQLTQEEFEKLMMSRIANTTSEFNRLASSLACAHDCKPPLDGFGYVDAWAGTVFALTDEVAKAWPTGTLFGKFDYANDVVKARAKAVREYLATDEERSRAFRTYCANNQIHRAFTTGRAVIQQLSTVSISVELAVGIALVIAETIKALEPQELDAVRRDFLEQQFVVALLNDQVAYMDCRTKIAKMLPCRVIIEKFCHSINDKFDIAKLSSADVNYIISSVRIQIRNANRPVVRQHDDRMDAASCVIDEITKFNPVVSTNEKEDIMNKTVAFETKHFVFGTDVKNMSEDELIEAIKQVEGEIAKLDTVKTESKKIAARKTELVEMLAKIVETLDAK